MTTAQADMVVRDRTGRLVVWVEVKAGPPLTAEAAAWIRNHVLLQIPPVRYFLLVSEERMLVWRLTEGGSVVANEWSCPMDAVIARYWPGRPSGRRMNEYQLQFITRLWLTDLTQAFPDEIVDETSQCLATSGVLEAIHGGSVLAEATA